MKTTAVLWLPVFVIFSESVSAAEIFDRFFQTTATPVTGRMSRIVRAGFGSIVKTARLAKLIRTAL